LAKRLRSDGIDNSSFVGVVEFLSRSPSCLQAAALEDIVGVLGQVNVPRTVHEHPNWRRRLPISLERLAEKFGNRLKCALECGVQ